MSELRNVADHPRRHAAERGEQPAIIVPDGSGWSSITYRELNLRVDRFAHGFAEKGLKRGDRVLFLVKPSIDFYAALFGLFRMGAIPVLMDPGMGLPALLGCIEQARPRAVLAIPIVHLVRLLKRRSFTSAEIFITAGTRWLWGGHTLRQCESKGDDPYPEQGDRSPADEGFIAFTSGSTGPPKGVSFVQRMFLNQARMLAERFDLGPDTVTVECFAAFVIFDLAIGMTVVIPDMDLSKPAKANPANVARAITEHKATCAFASPVVWQNVARWCQRESATLPTLDRCSRPARRSRQICTGDSRRSSGPASSCTRLTARPRRCRSPRSAARRSWARPGIARPRAGALVWGTPLVGCRSRSSRSPTARSPSGPTTCASRSARSARSRSSRRS